MAQIEILSEQEHPGRWMFTVQVIDDQGALRSHSLSLAWQDYNVWSVAGNDEPHRVADAVVNFLLSRMPATELPPQFDASLARRRFPHEADQEIPGLIGR